MWKKTQVIVCSVSSWRYSMPSMEHSYRWSLAKAVFRAKSQNHTIIQAAFVCLCVRSLSPPRSFDGSSSNLLGVCRWTVHLPLRGSFPKRSTGRRVNGSLSLSLIYMRQPHATQTQKVPIALLLQSLIWGLLLHCISTGNYLVMKNRIQSLNYSSYSVRSYRPNIVCSTTFDMWWRL